jgi:hypothetical protein
VAIRARLAKRLALGVSRCRGDSAAKARSDRRERESIVYEQLPASSKRLVNQAIFICLIVIDPDTIHAERTRFYDELAELVRQLRAAHPATSARRRATTPGYTDEGLQDDPDPENGAGVRTSSKWRRGRDSNPRWSLTPILA